jgi:hypothetical protein
MKESLKNRDKIVFILLMCSTPLHIPQLGGMKNWMNEWYWME